ncbi:MAG: tetratricopeptide repeat protein [Kiritimatiellae bacterium]|nr:tetratricopeptide repeat protein [Kiritimatiellia bacterium]
MRPALSIVAAAVAFAAVAEEPVDSLAVAKDALRDGLWEIARTYAVKSDGDEARLVFVESYAREGRWADVLKTLELHPEYEGDGFAYYRALALDRLGRRDDAAKALSAHRFADPAYASSATLLRISLARAAGDSKAILSMAAQDGFPSDVPEAMLAVAWAEESEGNGLGATNSWRSVLASTNASDKSVAEAAMRLGDVASLADALGRVGDAALRRAVGLRLGRVQIMSDGTFEEGAKSIVEIARDSPDAEGARDAILALAAAYYAKGRAEESARTFAEAMEAWPESARDAVVQENRAWALRRLGRIEESLDAYARSADCATNDADRARAVMEQGDVLAEDGRGDEAMAKYRDVLAKYPDTPSGRRLKTVVELRDMEAAARALYHDFKFDEAAAKFAEIARRDPARKPRMDYLEMLCLYGLGRDADAVAKARGIVDSSPDAAIRAEAALWLAKYCFNDRRWKESCGLFSNYATNLAPKSAQAPSALVWAARAASAAHDSEGAVDLVTRLVKDYPDSPEKSAGWLVQGEALVELARLDDALIVLDKVIKARDVDPADAFRARMLAADVLFVMGADSRERYREALDAYRALELGESATPGGKLVLAFKIGRTLEKMGRAEEAEQQYYAHVVERYTEDRRAGVRYDEESMSTFARAAFQLADIHERKGDAKGARRILRRVMKSDVATAIPEASRRYERLKLKGDSD